MMRILFRPFSSSPESSTVPTLYRYLRHPIFAWGGLRPILAQHTWLEHSALQKLAEGRKSIVEIGVAEGASALALRASMAPDGCLFLVDPFHLARFRRVGTLRRVARAAVRSCRNGRVSWIEEFSYNAARGWNRPIDLLFLDGDHTFDAVMRDWEDWHGSVVVGGVAVFHDARIFPGGWPRPDDGPVQLVNELFRRGRERNWRIELEVHSLVAVRRLS